VKKKLSSKEVFLGDYLRRCKTQQEPLFFFRVYAHHQYPTGQVSQPETVDIRNDTKPRASGRADLLSPSSLVLWEEF
jgi:hypothetical protein